MRTPTSLRLLILMVVFLVSCSPAVPYGQMPGYDLYGSANSNQMTADAYSQLANMQRQALTATAEAPIVRITETAAALAVQGTQAAGTNTASVQTQVGAMTATAIWWTPTPHLDSTATVAALNAQSTMIANQVARDNLQLQNDIRNQEIDRIFNYIVVFFFMLLGAAGFFTILRRYSFQPATVDARGNVLPMINVVDGTATDIDRNPNYQAQLKRGVITRLLETRLGLQPLLPAVTASRQDATTERDQMVDLATRGLPGPSSDTKERKQIASQAVANQVSETNLDNRFRMLDAVIAEGGKVDETIVTVLDQEWKEAEKK